LCDLAFLLKDCLRVRSPGKKHLVWLLVKEGKFKINHDITQAKYNMTDHTNQILKHWVLLLIVAVPLFSLGLSNHGIWSADEPRVAEIGREMATTGNWCVPTLNQKPFLEEPPLYYQSLALAFKVFGKASDKVVRIPSALFAFAGVMVTFFISNFLFGPRVALLSGIILATTGEYFRVAHWVIVDGALTFFVISAMGLFISGYLSESKSKKFLCYILLYLSCILAFFTKGFIGIVIPGLSIFVFLMAERNLKEIFNMRLWLGILLSIIMVLPWFITLWHEGGTEYLNVFLLHNHLQRFLPASMAGIISGSASGHHQPFYYYITQFPSSFLPWSILLIPALSDALSKTGKYHGLLEKGRLFAKCWFFAGMIFLSVASTKRALYLLPIFAPIAMLTALYIDDTLGSQPLNRMGRTFIWMFGILLLAIGLSLTPIYFNFKRVYLSDTPAHLSILVVVISILVTALSLAAIWYLLRRNMKRYWISVHISIVLALVFILVAILPVLDRHKSFVPFCQQVMAAVPTDQPLHAYQPDETLRGAVPFYTGRYVIEMEDIRSVATILQKKESVFIIIRDKREKLEKELLATDKLSILLKQEMGLDRALVLLSNKAQSTLTIPYPFKKRPAR
jgi:4-amino-4-deoxy-L-arabinose transferase-like glycosyltransferase